MTDTAPFHVGLTPQRVVDAAVELTRESHLMSWSIRDLARRLGVAQSVLYHHVGGKDLLCRQVVERMLERIESPDDALPWQEWFRALLSSAGPRAAEYPGTAKWMLMHGPTLPAVVPLVEAGLARLHAAGFGDQASAAYAVLLNSAMLAVSIGDDRLQHEGDGPRDHSAMMIEFQELAGVSGALQEMGQKFMRPFAEGGEGARRMRWDYYRTVVDVTIAGLDITLGPSADPV